MNKPKILLMPDLPGWAYDFTAQQIKNRLSHKYNFTILYNYVNNKQIAPIDATPYDLVFRFIGFRMSATEKVPKEKLITSVRSQASPERRPEEFSSEVILKHYCAISVVAKCLRTLLPGRCCPIFETQNGVDTDFFKPVVYNHNNFTIGFAGNSKHPNEKGVDLIQEAAKRAQVKCKIADRQVEWIPHEKMPDFYKDIDVYVCFSKSEGMPNSVLEAAAMGKPVISTAVGGVPEVITHGKTGFLVDRDVNVLTEAIQTLKNDRELYHFMSDETRKNILDHWTWEKRVKAYETMFDYALSVKMGD